MLYLIFYYLLISSVCLWAGIIIYSFIPLVKPGNLSFINCLITGLIGITCIGQWIVLFLPLNIFTLFAILVLCGIISFFRQEQITRSFRDCWLLNFRKRSPLFYMCLLCFVIMILIINAGPVMMDDTDSYHIQMVKWVQEYGTVPGIANLHLRFGFNSSWFSSIALMNYPVSGLNSYLSLNGLLSVWFCYFLLDRLTYYGSETNGSLLNNRAAACLILLFLCLLNWPLIRGSASSANYDFISSVCVIILFIDLKDDQKEVPIEWLIWPVYLCTIRMTNFPLLILSLVFIFYNPKLFSFGRLLSIFIFFVFVLIPFLARNVILSGYPVFPAYQIDIFSTDWKADKSKLIELGNYIKYFNRVNPMFQTMSVTEKLSFPDWIYFWYKYLFRFDKIIFSLSVLGYLISFWPLRKRKIFLFRVFLSVMVLQLISWFIIGPDPRFVYGPLLFGIFTGIAYLPSIRNIFSRAINYSLVLASFLVFMYGVMKIFRDDKYRNFLTPRILPVPATQSISVGQIKMHIPFIILNNWNPRCYDTELPCLYQEDPRLEARGEKIKDGFRLKKADQ
jgi:hypothetical protein